jgi:hypothetical protein
MCLQICVEPGSDSPVLLSATFLLGWFAMKHLGRNLDALLKF